MRFSFIVPFHNDLSLLERCLDALAPLPEDSELILAADGPVQDCAPLASRYGARMIVLPEPSGPAAARNAAASAAAGDILVFVDADVAVSRGGVARMRTLFAERPELSAVFGAYDRRPADPGFVSQYKNLSHSFIHHTSATRARTFWAGFGAVRREAFQRLSGFDERFGRPSVEDIDFGYRLTAAGYEVLLDPQLSASHLKRWTVASVIASDVGARGIPWTQLIWRYRALHDDLNVRTEYRWSVVLAYLCVGCAALALHDARFLISAMALATALTAINRRYYGFFYRERGAWFLARVWLLRFVHDLLNGLSFAVGTVLFLFARHVGVRLPGVLATDAWDAMIRDRRATVFSLPSTPRKSSN